VISQSQVRDGPIFAILDKNIKEVVAYSGAKSARNGKAFALVPTKTGVEKKKLTDLSCQKFYLIITKNLILLE